MKYVTYKLKEGMKLIFVNLRWKTKSCTGNVAPEWWYFCLGICHSFSTLSQYSLKNFPDFKKRHFLQPVFNEIQQISPRSWRLVTTCSQKIMKNATSTENFSCDMLVTTGSKRNVCKRSLNLLSNGLKVKAEC